MSNSLICNLSRFNLVNFTDFDIGQFLGTGDESSPLMMLIWILPIVLFVFYGQRIQLYVTAREIKKAIKKLDEYSTEAREVLLEYTKEALELKETPTARIDRFLDYFTIMPVDMDPTGIVDKVKRTVRIREDHTRKQVKAIAPDAGDIEMAKVQTLLEIASSLRMIHRMVNHMFLTAKKQNNYPLILPLQMILPFVMEQSVSMKYAVHTFRNGQPVGDGIGSMVIGSLMLDLPKETVALHTVLARTEFEGRTLLLLKAEGPRPTVGRPADALAKIIQVDKVDAIIMVDAALKMEGEDSASVANGFGAAIGGIGTERFEIEEKAKDGNIPIFSIVIKQTVREAVTLMTKEIADQEDTVRSRIYETIQESTSPGQSVIVIGVGNTVGISQ